MIGTILIESGGTFGSSFMQCFRWNGYIHLLFFLIGFNQDLQLNPIELTPSKGVSM